MQKRITKLCRAGLLALVTWVVALHVTAAGEPLHMLVLLVRCSHREGATPTSLSPTGPSSHHPALLQAPLLFLVAFGSYLLVLLIAGALSFRTCPEDAKALQQVGWNLPNAPPVALVCCAPDPPSCLFPHRTFAEPGTG